MSFFFHSLDNKISRKNEEKKYVYWNKESLFCLLIVSVHVHKKCLKISCVYDETQFSKKKKTNSFYFSIFDMHPTSMKQQYVLV